MILMLYVRVLVQLVLLKRVLQLIIYLMSARASLQENIIVGMI